MINHGFNHNRARQGRHMVGIGVGHGSVKRVGHEVGHGIGLGVRAAKND